VYVNDSHSSANITVYMYRRDEQTGSVQETSTSSTSGTPGNDTLATKVGWDTWSVFLFRVYVPANSGGDITKVYSYAAERAPT